MNAAPQHSLPEGPEDELLSSLLNKRSYLKPSMDTPLRKLRKNLSISAIYGLIITMGYALLIFYFPIWQVQVGLLVVIAFNILLLLKGWQLQADIDRLMLDEDVLGTLKAVRDRFRRWFRQQYRMAIFVYPIAASAGFMLGGTLGSGKSLEVFMSKWQVQVALVVSIVVLLPLCLWLARWLNRQAFGKYVDQLQDTIDGLENKG